MLLWIVNDLENDESVAYKALAGNQPMTDGLGLDRKAIYKESIDALHVSVASDKARSRLN